MKRYAFILGALILTADASAKSPPDMTLGDHLTKEDNIALKNKSKTWLNKDHGHKIRIHGMELIDVLDKYVIYFTDLSFNNVHIFVTFPRDENFNTAFKDFIKQDSQHNAWLNRLSKEGGGTGTIGYKSKLPIYVKAQPQGWLTHTYKGKTKEDLQFRVLEICNSTYKVCSKVNEPTEPSIIDKFFNLFK